MRQYECAVALPTKLLSQSATLYKRDGHIAFPNHFALCAGTIPLELGLLSKLEGLYLSGNKLTGEGFSCGWGGGGGAIISTST